MWHVHLLFELVSFKRGQVSFYSLLKMKLKHVSRTLEKILFFFPALLFSSWLKLSDLNFSHSFLFKRRLLSCNLFLLTHWTTTSSLSWLTFSCLCAFFFQALARHIFTPPSASSARCWMSWPSYGCSCVPLPCGFLRGTYPGCSGGIGMLTSMTLRCVAA